MCEFKWDYYIIAIDFDYTICKGGWPDIEEGELIQSTIWKMYEQIKKQPKTVFILWTCRAGEKLQEAIDFCKKHNLPIEYFNEQHPSVYEWWEGQLPIKIYANEYWDDKAVKI